MCDPVSFLVALALAIPPSRMVCPEMFAQLIPFPSCKPSLRCLSQHLDWKLKSRFQPPHPFVRLSSVLPQHVSQYVMEFIYKWMPSSTLKCNLHEDRDLRLFSNDGHWAVRTYWLKKWMYTNAHEDFDVAHKKSVQPNYMDTIHHSASSHRLVNLKDWKYMHYSLMHAPHPTQPSSNLFWDVISLNPA